eukprot:gene16157-biopygen5456
MELPLYYHYSQVHPDPGWSDGTQLATEEGCSSGLSNSSNNEAVVLNPLGRMIADTAKDEKPKQFRNNKNHTIATWNVRTMNQGKLEVVTNEMDRINLDILGISEMKWTGCGDFRYGDHTVYYSGQIDGKDAIQAVKTLPGADCGTDHVLLHATIKGKEIKERWKQYTQCLYSRDADISNDFTEEEFTEEPEPTLAEIEHAIKEVACNKAPGIDNIPIELQSI